MPPQTIFDTFAPKFIPATNVETWLRATFIEFGGLLWNEEHTHLQSASLGVTVDCRAKRSAHEPDGASCVIEPHP